MVGNERVSTSRVGIKYKSQYLDQIMNYVIRTICFKLKTNSKRVKGEVRLLKISCAMYEKLGSCVILLRSVIV